MLAVHRPIEVITTCAQDYLTWRNEYPAGESILNGVTVRRFGVDFERNAAFHRLMSSILGGLPLQAYHRHKTLMRALIARPSREQQLSLLRFQGPYSTPLLEHLAHNHRDYEAIFFFTYLYATTYHGSLQVPAAKTVLIPTAHDEAMIFLPLYRSMFQRFAAIAFLTPEEQEFVSSTFPIEDALQTIIGMPVTLPSEPDASAFRRKHRIRWPFILYAGRIDPSKGCGDLFRYFRQARRRFPDLHLVLIGSRAMSIPRDRYIHYLGHVSEAEKLGAMAAATVFVNPSAFESFSIVTLEAMLCGAPVLVNGQSEVLKGHVGRSSAGLYYESGPEFIEALQLLLGDIRLRSQMANNGRIYVHRNYGRAVVEERYKAFVERVIAHTYSQPGAN